jgi:hypothetical protein
MRHIWSKNLSADRQAIKNILIKLVLFFLLIVFGDRRKKIALILY